MKILIDNLILITMDREHHATSYQRFRDAHSYLVIQLWAKEEIIGHIMSFFQGGIGMFDLIFLSCFSTKM